MRSENDRDALPGGGERGSLPLAMLLVLLAVALGTAAVPAAMGQLGHTRQTVDRANALRGAQTGLEVALARIRSMTTLDELCGDQTGTDPVTLAVTGGRPSYRVAAQFLTAVGQDEPPATDAEPTPCRGSNWAKLTATATAGSATRRLSGYYPLRSGDLPSPFTPADDMYTQPRLIAAFAALSTYGDYEAVCLDPGQSVPGEGAAVTMQSCPKDFRRDLGITYKQYWYYRTDLTLATVGSIRSAPDAADAMCLDAGSDTPAVGAVPRMRACVTPVPPRQRWYYNGGHTWELGTAAGTLSGLCLTINQPDSPGSGVHLEARCSLAARERGQQFDPFPYLGPGESGLRSTACPEDRGYACELTQLRNAALNSFCLTAIDSSNDNFAEQVEDPTFAAPAECYQNPDLTAIPWSQLMRIPATPTNGAGSAPGPIYTRSGNTEYCMDVAGRLVRPMSCTGAATQKWIRYGDTGDYDTSYRIVNAGNRKCLAALTTEEQDSDPSQESLQIYRTGYVYTWKLATQPCRTSANPSYDDEDFAGPSLVRMQKWNTPGEIRRGGRDETPAPAPEPVPTAPLRNLTGDQ
ncbi:hypothetical protein GCM10010123_43850 [Pilimelia anulata]|uniref:Ricin B lectin domain-containing protein n=1 Tax=Pilimelia anulata TaxID=53371 RepID=A0A8J3BHT3_9ACTN|nr:RICIN domain-containing protein [Pilimelia anulata]GGK09212.1 hypothetical protein GCM10010123_43850 [Pilimelia anulata]